MAERSERSPMPDLLRRKPLIGMVHLPPLPGSPRSELSLDEVIEVALDEAAILERAGLDGLIVENVGDTPFFRESVPTVTVAAMGIIVREVRRATSLAVGVNLLRNACLEAMSIAALTHADFIRCNVVIGAYVTDQGLIQGCAAELARLRQTLDHDVAVLGDVHVKHAAPLFDVPIEDAAADLAERGGADAVIVSGARSPDPPSFERVKAVRDAVTAPVLIGSGVSLANVADFYAASDGVLIGETDFKVDGVWGGRSDGAAYAEAVRRCRGS
jgi:membrane complex biogenesis BtpA family protein